MSNPSSLTIYGGNIPIHVMNHGLKKGSPPKADIYLDARGFPDHGPNPDEEYIKWVKGVIPYAAYKEVLLHNLQAIHSRRKNRPPMAQNAPIRVCCLCAFGIHRSLTMKRMIVADLKYWFPQREIKDVRE